MDYSFMLRDGANMSIDTVYVIWNVALMYTTLGLNYNNL